MAFGTWDQFALSLKSAGEVCCGTGGTSTQTLFFALINKWYHIVFGQGIIKFGTDIHTLGNSTNTAGAGELCIFAASSGATAPYSWGGYGKLRIGSFKIYEGTVDNTASSTLVHNYIPCYRISDSVIGLYDVVTNVFYVNAGTGTFSKGPDMVNFNNPITARGNSITANLIKTTLFNATVSTKNAVPYLTGITLPYAQPDATTGNLIKASVFQNAAETTIARLEKNIGTMEAACRSHFSNNASGWSVNCGSNTVGSWSRHCYATSPSWSVNCSGNAGFWSSNNNFQGFATHYYAWYGDCYGHAGHGSACHWRSWTNSTNCSKNKVGSWGAHWSSNTVGSWSVNCAKNTVGTWSNNAASFTANNTTFTVQGLDFQ